MAVRAGATRAAECLDRLAGALAAGRALLLAVRDARSWQAALRTAVRPNRTTIPQDSRKRTRLPLGLRSKRLCGVRVAVASVTLVVAVLAEASDVFAVVKVAEHVVRARVARVGAKHTPVALVHLPRAVEPHARVGSGAHVTACRHASVVSADSG